jgi:hypothetical protein
VTVVLAAIAVGALLSAALRRDNTARATNLEPAYTVDVRASTSARVRRPGATRFRRGSAAAAAAAGAGPGRVAIRRGARRAG